MKTINLELSKKLNELGLIKHYSTEYYWCRLLNDTWKILHGNEIKIQTQEEIGAMNLEEAIEFLIKQKIVFTHIMLPCTNNYNHVINEIRFINGMELGEMFMWGDKEDGYSQVELYGETLLEGIEKMLEYLLDNDLLGKKK